MLRRGSSNSSPAGIDARLRRLESASGASERARHEALQDAAVRLLSDEDLLAMAAWIDSPEAKAGHPEPAHLNAAWERALEAAAAREQAGGTLPQ